MKQHYPTRPARCEPGSMDGRTKEMAERLRLSRERLMASDLSSTTRAWRLWAACVDATVGYTREADQTYAVTLATAANVKRQVASSLLLQFGALGIFQWEPARQGSRDARILALPALLAPSRPHSGATRQRSRPQSGAVKGPDHGPTVGPLHSDEVMSVELSTHDSSLDTGTQHSSLIGAPDRVEGSEDWHAERHARPQSRPEPAYDPEDLARQIEAELEAPSTAERFPPYHEDERTGDGVADDERSQLRWEAANPSKARRR